MSKFRDEHKIAFGNQSSLTPGGFPDCGNGFYSDKLPYHAWYDFNNAVRVHLNFVESLPSIVSILLICGLIYPLATAIIGAINCVTRIIYILMYLQGGPNQRIIGAVGGSGPLYGLALLSFCTLCYQIMSG